LEQALSEDEAKFLSKFYDSPTGKKSVEVNPELAKAGKTAMQTQVVPFLKKLRAEAAGGPPAGEFQPSDLKSQLDAIPPEKKELIGRMIKFTHPADSVREGIAGFEQSQKVRINADPSIPPQEKAKLISISDKYVALLNTRVNWSAALEPIFSIEFNRLFSRDDLQNLVSFYETPSQEAISKKMATALNQGFETLQKLWVEKISRVAEQAKAGT
ncbi:MAG: DUF2059 domain-containing protein, partial [Cyanobacteria bacterium]|nr:DUF2059 domain-containing protein [Cyanobacteriota bacterium]